MKKFFAILACVWALSPTLLRAQEDLINLDASTNGTEVSMEAMGGTITLHDDDSQGTSGNPMRNIDYHITIAGNCEGENRISIFIDDLSVSCIDTVFIYDGPSVNDPLIVAFNSFTGNVQQGDFIFIGPNNNTNKVTIRFKTGDITNTQLTNLECYRSNGGIGHGFSFAIDCRKPCETLIPVIDDEFYRTRHGVIYDTAYIHEITLIDTIYIDPEDHSQGIDHVDTNRFMGANLCIGDGVIFRAHGIYSYKYGYYTPSDATSYFTWNLANDNDTIEGVGVNQIEYGDYQHTGCYDLTLDMVDEYGCGTDLYTSIKVRTAMNPIKTIFTLSDICNYTSLPVNMGYDGENATLTLREIEANDVVSKTYESITFIPDGCGCTNPNYFEAPVEFTEFPNTGRISAASDICSICINMEHTWIGDVYMTIVCPTGQEALLKFGNPSSCSPAGLPSNPPEASTPGGYHGSNINLGWPTHDDGGQCSDPWNNRYGIGLDYCFSRNRDYTLITGDNAGAVWTPANIHPAGDFYISTGANSTNTITTTDPVYGFAALGFPNGLPPCPDYVDESGVSHPFPAGAPTVDGTQSRRPSNHIDKTDYYLPYTDFTELVGCPLNGTWKVRVYDTWGGDNGWIFNWSMDICNISQNNDCKYTVGIDSLVWRPDPSDQYHDYDLGHYRGVVIERETPTLSYISTPDTAGTFPINVFIYDEFGCVWDTTTRITSYWTPEPNLGTDTALCGVDQAILDATDRHTETEHYTYVWSPYGENTPTIETHEGAHGDIVYVTSVTNNCGPNNQKRCTARDTIIVSIRKQPLPNFSPVPFSFEGCDPMTITFENTSIDASSHLWVFGDGVTSELESPTHTYAEGIYTLKYYAMSDEGCIDSIVSEGGIAVYPTPQASFTWDPVYPSVLNPVVNYTNTTTPHSSNTQYYWQLQYDRNNPLSFETLTTRNASFDYSQYNENVSGNYSVNLVARTSNLAPSGNVIFCADTAANNVLVINDFLQFPNVVTPNGDGINDVFIIQNLVDGLAYPINSLDIYNQWGARVFHRENIDSEDDFWDPSDVPDGTYFYRFSARGYNGNIEHNGSIEVLH